jgi:hypothetical protein
MSTIPVHEKGWHRQALTTILVHANGPHRETKVTIIVRECWPHRETVIVMISDNFESETMAKISYLNNRSQ